MILEINNQVVDLPTSRRGLIKLQKSLASLSDLETRTGEYSWSLTLPPTRRNAGVFGQLLHAQTLDKFVGSYAFRLRSGGQEWRGVFLLSSLKRGYTGSLSTDSFSWARALGEKKLSELTTLRAIEYDGTQLAEVLAMDCDATDLQFPFIGYGNFFAPPSVKILADGTEQEVPYPAGAGIGPEPLGVDDYPPSVYYLNVLKAIFREAGYFLQSPLLSSAEVRSWCITATGSDGTFWPWGSILPARATTSARFDHFSNFRRAGAEPFSNTAGDAFDTESDIFFMPVRCPVRESGGTRALSGADGLYLAPIEGSYSFAWEAVLSNGAQQYAGVSSDARQDLLPVGLALLVFRGGEGFVGADGGLCKSGVALDAEQDRVLEPLHRLDIPGSDNLKSGVFSGTADLYLEAGDTVRLCIFARRSYLDADGQIRRWREQFYVSVQSARLECTAFDGPTLLEPAKVLPPLLQKDVVKDFLVKTNTVPVVDQDRRIITLLSREAHTQAQGEPLELDSFTDAQSLEYAPVLGGAGVVVFSPAPDSSDFILAAGAAADARATEPDSDRDAEAANLVDVVRVAIAGGQADSEKQVSSCFAATGLRTYTLGATRVALPCVATKSALATPRSEVNGTDLSGTPRVVRYLGTDDSLSIPFIPGNVPLARADYGGPLAWAGDSGAVATGYRDFLSSAARGHLCRASAALTPARYAQLTPGRRVWLLGAEYQVEKLEGFDPENPASPTTLELLRRV